MRVVLRTAAGNFVTEFDESVEILEDYIVCHKIFFDCHLDNGNPAAPRYQVLSSDVIAYRIVE